MSDKMKGGPQDPRLLFVSTDLTLPEIAEKLAGQRGCSLTRLKHRSADEDWVSARREFRQKAADRANRRAARKAAVELGESDGPPPPDAVPLSAPTGTPRDTGSAPTATPPQAAPPVAAPRTGLRAARSLHDLAVDGALDALADKMAKTAAKEIELRDGIREDALMAVSTLMSDIAGLAIAKRYRRHHPKNAAGHVEVVVEGDDEIDITKSQKLEIARSLDQLHAMYERIERNSLLTSIEKQRLGIDRLEAEVELVKAQVAAAQAEAKKEADGKTASPRVEVLVRTWNADDDKGGSPPPTAAPPPSSE